MEPKNNKQTEATNRNRRLTFLYTNADNLINKRSELLKIIQIDNADIICVTETLPKNVFIPITKAELQIPGYSCFENIDEELCQRGVVIYTKHNIHAVRVEIKEKFHDGICCEIKLKKPNKNLLVYCIYRSPNSSQENNDEINKFYCDIKKFSNHEVIIVGDFNFPEIDWVNNIYPVNIENKATSFYLSTQSALLTQKVTEFTHQRPGQNPTLIDLVLTNNDYAVNDINHMAPIGKSHHHVLKFDYICGELSKVDDCNNDPIYKYHCADYKKLKEELSHVNWSEEIEHSDIDQMWSKFNSVMQKAIQKYIPKVKVGKSKKVKPLWMNNNALFKVKRKNHAYHRYLRTKEGQDYLEYA